MSCSIFSDTWKHSSSYSSSDLPTSTTNWCLTKGRSQLGDSSWMSWCDSVSTRNMCWPKLDELAANRNFFRWHQLDTGDTVIKKVHGTVPMVLFKKHLSTYTFWHGITKKRWHSPVSNPPKVFGALATKERWRSCEGLGCLVCWWSWWVSCVPCASSKSSRLFEVVTSQYQDGITTYFTYSSNIHTIHVWYIYVYLPLFSYLHFVALYCKCSAIYTVYPSNFFKHIRKHSQVARLKDVSLVLFFWYNAASKNIKISEANHCNKTVTGQGILHLFFPSLNYAMNFREGSPQIRMLSCFFPKPSLPHTLWGSVFGLTFTPPEARPLGGPRERVCPWKVTSKTQ